MNDRLLSECALFDIQRASRVVARLYNSHLRAADLTVAQWSLLRNIAAMRRVSVGRLAEAVAMERSSVTRLVEPLIDQKLARRGKGGGDKRVRNLEVTPRGKAKIRAGVKHWRAAQRELMEALGSGKWLAMRQSLRSTIRLVRQRNA